MIVAKSISEFSPGPLPVRAESDLATLADGERLLIMFDDYEMLLSVIGRARGALHLGGFLTPFEYLHWRLEERNGTWSLVTADRAEISRLRRYYKLPATNAL